MSRKLIAKMNFTYAGRRLKPGDEFEATSRDATALAAYGRARLVTAAATDTSDQVTAEVLATTRKTRRYRRRDMRASEAS